MCCNRKDLTLLIAHERRETGREEAPGMETKTKEKKNPRVRVGGCELTDTSSSARNRTRSLVVAPQSFMRI